LERVTGNFDAIFQSIQYRVAKNFPPLPPRGGLAGRRGFPVACFLERRCVDGGTLVVGPHGATRAKYHGRDRGRKKEEANFHEIDWLAAGTAEEADWGRTLRHIRVPHAPSRSM